LNSLGAFGIALAIAVPVGTVALTLGTQLPASATVHRAFCTNPTTGGSITFSNTNVLYALNPTGITEQGQFEASPTNSATSVNDTAIGTCHTGTTDTGAPALGAGTVTNPGIIQSTPCQANVGDPPAGTECEIGSSFKGTVTAGSPELDLTVASPVQSGTSPPVTPFQQIILSDAVDMSTTAQNSNWSTTGVTVSSTCGDGGLTGEPCAGTTPGTSYIDFSNNFNGAGTVTVIVYSAVQLPAGQTGNYWYGSGTAFASGGTSSILNSLPVLVFHIHDGSATGPIHVVSFKGEQAASVTTPEAGFEIYGYSLDCGVSGTVNLTTGACTTTGSGSAYYNDGSSATCTATSALTLCPSREVALIQTDTGTHADANATVSGIQNFTMKKGATTTKLVLTVANTNAWAYVKACSTNCYVTGTGMPANDYITAVAGTGAINTSIITVHAATTVTTTPRVLHVQMSDFLKDIGAVQAFPPASAHTASDNAVSILTATLDHGLAVNSTGPIAHSYFQS